MNASRHLGGLRALAAAGAIFCTVAPGIAQPPAAQQAQGGSSATQDKKWFKDPGGVMPMRKMTSAERRAAAQRNAQRRAADHLPQGPHGVRK
jgi:hypothetical protein